MLLPKKPVQGIWGLVEKMLEKYGALNKKYDSNLDGVIDADVDGYCTKYDANKDGLIDNADKVDGYDAGTGANQVLVLNSAGQVPLANIPLLPDSQLDFSFAWELVGSISSSGVSSIEFSNLAGDTDKIYMLVFGGVNSSTSNSNGIYARFNADTEVGNYGFIDWNNTDGTVGGIYQGYGSSSGTAGALVGALPANTVGLFWSIIFAEGIYDGSTYTYVFCVSKGYSTNTRYSNDAGGWRKQAEVTSITLFTGAGIAIDWVAYLFKPKW